VLDGEWVPVEPVGEDMEPDMEPDGEWVPVEPVGEILGGEDNN